jgi:hypothetical protein
LSNKPSLFLKESLTNLQNTERMSKVEVDFDAPWCIAVPKLVKSRKLKMVIEEHLGCYINTDDKDIILKYYKNMPDELQMLAEDDDMVVYGHLTKCCFSGCNIMQKDDESFVSTIRDGFHVTPEWYNNDTSRKLYAISGFSRGRIVSSLKEYHIGDISDIIEFENRYGTDVEIPDYSLNPIEFYSTMSILCDKLDAVGL